MRDRFVVGSEVASSRWIYFPHKSGPFSLRGCIPADLCYDGRQAPLARHPPSAHRVCTLAAICYEGRRRGAKRRLRRIGKPRGAAARSMEAQGLCAMPARVHTRFGTTQPPQGLVRFDSIADIAAPRRPPHTHAYTHMHIRAGAHARTNACIHECMHARTDARECERACTHACTHTCQFMNAHTRSFGLYPMTSRGRAATHGVIGASGAAAPMRSPVPMEISDPNGRG